MPETFADQLAAAVAAVGVGPGSGYSWLGERIDLPARVVGLAPPEVVRETLVQGIARRLYGDFFSPGTTRPAVRAVGASGRRRMSERLAAANSGRGCLDPAWRVVGAEAGRLIVARDGLRLWVLPETVVHGGPGAPSEGSEVSVRLAPDAPNFSPGYYMVLGDHGLDPDSPRLLDRFYVHLRPEGAEELVRRATGRLNGAGLPFRLKVVDDPDGYDRRDTAIFAFQRKDRDRAVPEVLRLRDGIAPFIAPGIPSLTRRVAPGVAFAEDPGGGESFGADRSRLIAEALVTAHEAGLTVPEERLAAVGRRLREAGTSIEAPYLGPDSRGELDLLAPARAHAHAEERSQCP